MQARESQFAIRLLPSMTDFAFLMPILFLFGRMDGLQSLLGDCDTGWHIRTGDWIMNHGWVPVRDIFSYSKPGGVWYAWEWLSDIVLAWLNNHGGLQAVAIFAIVLLCATYTLLFRLALRHANAIVAIAITMAAAASSSIHWLARPHLFTLFFAVLFYGALQHVQQGKTRLAGVPYLAVLPVATVLWTNLHGGFFVGISLVVAFGLGETLAMAFSVDRAQVRPHWLKAKKYFLCALACLAASLVNPYTYHLHVHVVKYLGDPYQRDHIMEFLSLNFHHPIAIFFEGLLLLSSLACCWYIARGQFTEPLLLVIWAHASLLAARNIPIFMIVATPPIAAMVTAWLARLPEWNVAGWVRGAAHKFNEIAAEMGDTDRIARWHLVSAAGVLAVAALLYAPHPPKRFRAEFDPKSYPAGAIETLRRDPSAHIFTYDQWGDYLIYRLYPGTKVFVDGRSDYYGDDFEKNILDVLNVNYAWEKTLARFNVDTILLPPSVPLTGALKESSRWRVVYDDGVSLVFRSTGRTVGKPVSLTAGDGKCRGREITKTQASGLPITITQSKT